MEDIKALLKEHREEIKGDVKKQVDVAEKRFRKHTTGLAERFGQRVEKAEERFTKHTAELEKKFEGYIGVVSEDFHSKVSLIAEQYTSIDKKLDSRAEAIAAVKEGIEIIKVDVEFIKHSLKKKVDVDEFAVLERRATALEAKVRV